MKQEEKVWPEEDKDHADKQKVYKPLQDCQVQVKLDFPGLDFLVPKARPKTNGFVTNLY